MNRPDTPPGPSQRGEKNLIMDSHSYLKREIARQLKHSMTPYERRLWQRLRAGGLYGLKFRRQQVIAGFIVDFYCHSVRLAIEVDGGVHDAQREYDMERSDVLGRLAVRVIRFRNAEVQNDIEGVMRKLATYLGYDRNHADVRISDG
jgi:very-short-patch-repair endonuclease